MSVRPRYTEWVRVWMKFINSAAIFITFFYTNIGIANDGPDAKTTMSWIATHFSRCGEMRYSKGLGNIYVEHTWEFEVRFNNATMNLIEASTEYVSKNGVSAVKRAARDIVVDLSKLSPDVATNDDHFYAQVELVCPFSKCVSIKSRTTCEGQSELCDERFPYQGSAEAAKLEIESCEAESLANALSNLISLRGGEESPF